MEPTTIDNHNNQIQHHHDHLDHDEDDEEKTLEEVKKFKECYTKERT